MSEDQRHESLLDRDWGDEWESLPEAPPLVPRRQKSAQLTLRVPTRLVTALRRMGASRTLPYHSLARSWIVEGLRSKQLPSAEIELLDEEEAATEQLNLKLEPETLAELKAFSDQVRHPYHRLARQWIEAAIARERAAADPNPSSSPRLAMRDLMILLLHSAPDPSRSTAIQGITRLQKLLFVIEQALDSEGSQFYAWNFGPFDEQVNDTADGLRARGLLTDGAGVSSASPPSFEDMMSTIIDRSGPRQERPAVFELNADGHALAERLRRSNTAYEHLYKRVAHLRREWDTPDLIERVYETFPEYTTRSVIRDEIAERRSRRPRQN